MEFKIVITSDAEADLDRIIKYLLYKKNNRQAASNVLKDFEETKNVFSLKRFDKVSSTETSRTLLFPLTA